LELVENKGDSRGQKGQSRKQKAERIEKLEVEGCRDGWRGQSREFTTYDIQIVATMSSIFLVLVF